MSLIEQAAKRLEELRRAGAETAGVAAPATSRPNAAEVEHVPTPEGVVRELAGAQPVAGAPRGDGVAAPARGGEPGGVQPVEDRRQRAELEPVQLDVLPRGELAVASPELVRDLADRA